MKGHKMISKLLPQTVACSEQIGEFSGRLLRGEEEALGLNAVMSRRNSFTAGRTCARQALKAIGMPEVPIPRGQRGEPIWPNGIVGSITHCKGYCATAVAHNRDALALGIDAEANEALPSNVLDTIALKAEIDWIQRARKSPCNWDTLLFSIKESVYKAWYPVVHCWLDFEQVLVAIYPETSSFNARILSPASVQAPPNMVSLQGRYSADKSLILTAIFVSRGLS
jgi:4'-phosphopantetheinyl transferase EntD